MIHAITREEEALAESYVLERGLDMRAVVAQSPTIVETLRSVRAKIREYFGEVPARLSLRPDPEVHGTYSIVVEILATSKMSDAFERQGRFDREWWLEVWGRETADICILIGPV